MPQKVVNKYAAFKSRGSSTYNSIPKWHVYDRTGEEYFGFESLCGYTSGQGTVKDFKRVFGPRSKVVERRCRICVNLLKNKKRERLGEELKKLKEKRG